MSDKEFNEVDEYRVSKMNRRDVQDRETNRRGNVVRMGQPPASAHKAKDLSRKKNKDARSIKEFR